MAYTALYRKFRPLKFEDMVGEDHITRTLKNQIIAGRVGHAYLFNGGRGTGKTTSAKIMARAVNCLNPQDGEPCNECEICREILEGSLTDVVEMDAASNNSVDDIRSIRDEVNFLPTKAKYRVYIIDEVHMLTQGAFNALLKTLEEPPEHVKFILATTEPQKLPTTILSRCQRFDFKRITDENIIKRLKIICSESNIKISEAALKLIATLAEGAMRDGISILERCCQETVEEIDIDLVKELVGIPNLEHISKLTRSVLEKNEVNALKEIDEVIKEGKDLYNFLWEVIKYVKDILVYKSSGDKGTYSETEITEIAELSKVASSEKLLNIIYELSELENDIKWSSQKTIMFQTGILKLCFERKNDGIEDIVNRMSELENRIANGNFAVNVTQTNTSSNGTNLVAKQTTNNSESLVKQIPDKSIEKNTKSDSVKTKGTSSSSADSKPSTINWKNIISKLRGTGKIRLFSCLATTKVNEIGDMILEIEFPNGLTSFQEDVLNDNLNKKDLEKVIFEETGKEWHIKLKDGKKEENSNKQSNNPIDNLGIDINIIDN